MLIMIKSAINEFEERKAIRKTWLPKALKLNMTVIFSVGFAESETINEKILNETKLYGDILQTNFVESYHHLALKTYSNMRWISSYCSNIERVFFTDSDVIVFPEALLEMATNLKNQNTVVGHCWMTGAPPVRDNTSKSYMPKEVWSQDMYPPYCSGTGYFMTGDVPDKLLNVIPNGSDNWRWAHRLDHLEDVVFTGLLTSMAKVRIQHTNHIIYNRESLWFDLCQRKTISLHSFRPAEFFMKTYTSYMEYVKHCDDHHRKRKIHDKQ